jgi:cell division protein FtsB
MVSNDMGIVLWYQLHRERNQVKAEIDQLIQEDAELTNELDRLTNDKEYIKKIAREKFYMVKPGEKVFRVIDRKKAK